MTQTAPSLEIVRNHLNGDIKACENLLALLSAERDALKARDSAQLEEVITQKTTNLAQLEQGAKQRALWVASQKASADKSETLWQTMLDRLDPKLLLEWQRFKDLLAHCQIQNEVNGKMLARNQKVFSRLLAIVRGQSETSPLYTPKGSRGAGGAYQKLGEA